MSDVTIIVPHLGADEQQEFALEQCLKSLKDTVSDTRVLVVKNGPACQHTGDIWIQEQGQCRAVNAGASTVSTKWLFVTNDDMVYAPGWMENLMTTARTYKLRFLCPNLVEPRPGAPPFLVKPFGGAGGDFDLKSWLEFAQLHQDETREQGFNLPFLIDRETWWRLFGYDVNYDPWGSNGDSDLQAKLILAGLDTTRDRNVIVYHFSQTSGTFHPDNQSYWQKNWDYFVQKWGFERQPEANMVWYSREIIDYGRLIYHPEWEKKLGNYTKATYDPIRKRWFPGDKRA